MSYRLIKITGINKALVDTMIDNEKDYHFDRLFLHKMCNLIIDDNGFFIEEYRQGSVLISEYEEFNRWMKNMISAKTFGSIELSIKIDDDKIVHTNEGKVERRSINTVIKLSLSDLCDLYINFMDTDSSINTLCEEIFLQLPKANPWFTKDVLISVDG